MQITSVRISIPKDTKRGMLAYATIVLDDCFAVHGVKVIGSETGAFIAMPSKPNKKARDGKDKFLDIVHPLNHDCRQMIDNAVLDAYEDELNKGNK